MSRKKRNARRVYKPKKIRTKPSRVVVISPCWWQDDRMSPGVLRAVAEWRR